MQSMGLVHSGKFSEQPTSHWPKMKITADTARQQHGTDLWPRMTLLVVPLLRQQLRAPCAGSQNEASPCTASCCKSVKEC